MARVARSPVEVRPLRRSDWPRVEALFGERGACAGCWCMTWRLSRKAWEAGRGDGNRRALKRLVEARAESDAPIGVLALAAGRAVGWCSTGPRAEFVALATKRSLATTWDARTWSVTCFFVDKAWRRRGLGRRMLASAVQLARAHGASRVEGYPVPLPKDGADLPPVFAWTGLPQVFERCGFERLAELPGKRPIYVKALARAPKRKA